MVALKERFLDKVSPVDNPDDCWIWIGARGKSGYGHIWIDGKYVDAHRASYMLYVGEIPEGKLILHECDNKLCVNPHHLKLGTHHDNSVDYCVRHPHPMPSTCTFKGRKHTAESKQIMSIKAMGNTYCKGRPLSARTKRDQYGRFVKLGKGE